MPQADYFNELTRTISDAKDLIVAAHSSASITVRQIHVQTVTEAAFLKAFVAWEHFVERSLLGYMLGELSATSISVKRFSLPADEDHARKMLMGTNRYVDYSNHEIVSKLCTLHLEKGEPFVSVIKSIANDLQDMKTIRNASAHMTSSTIAPLNALATRLLGATPSPLTPHALLVTNIPTFNDTGMNYYCSVILAAAQRISEATP